MSHAFENHVEERLDALERRNRRLRRAVIGLAVFAVVHVLATVTWFLLPPPVVKARKFAAVDHNGVVRADLDATNADMASVSLYDRHGKLMAALTENGGHAALFYFDATQDLDRLALYTQPGGARLVVKDAAGGTQAELVLTETERGLRFFDAAGKPLPPTP